MFGEHPASSSLLVSRALLGDDMPRDVRERLEADKRMGERARALLAEAQARRAEIVGGPDPSGKGDANDEPAFKAGDLVWVDTEAWQKSHGAGPPRVGKLGPRWTGPHAIRRMIGDRAAELVLPEGYKCHSVFNIYQLQKDKGTRPLEGSQNLPDPVEMSEVERLVTHEFMPTRKGEYVSVLARWVGHTSDEDMWLDVTQANRRYFSCPEVFAAYAKQLRGGERRRWDACMKVLLALKRFREPYLNALGS